MKQRSQDSEDSDLFNLTLKRVREQDEEKEQTNALPQRATSFTVVPTADAPRPLRSQVAQQPAPTFKKPNWRPTDKPTNKGRVQRVHSISFVHRSAHGSIRKAYEHDAEAHGEADSWEGLHNVGAMYNNLGRFFAPLWSTLDMTVSAADDAKCAAWYFSSRTPFLPLQMRYRALSHYLLSSVFFCYLSF